MSEDKRNIEIPEEVIQRGKGAVEAYKEYVRLEGLIESHPRRFWTVPHPNPEAYEEDVTIDCRNPMIHVNKWTANLSTEKKAEIRAAWSEIQSLKSKRGVLKRKWSGTKRSSKDFSILDEKKTEILEMMGQWKTNAEIKEEIKKRWCYSLSTPQLSRFKLANKEKIEELKTEWATGHAEMYVAQERGRVETLAYLLKTQMDKYKEKNFPISHSKEARGILEQIRKEVKGDVVTINGKIDVQQTLLVNKTIDQVTQKVNINSMVIALVAARRGLDPVKFMNRLANSYYSKYTGLTQSKSTEEDAIQYPSKLIYNWQEIDQNNQESQSIEDVEFEEIKEDNDLRKKLEERLMIKKKKLE